MEIRLATSEDFEIFLPAKQAFFIDYNISKKERESGKTVSLNKIFLKSRSFYEKEFSNFIKDILILVIEDNKVIGYLAGKIETNIYEKYGYISEVFVEENSRGRGLSTLLKDKFLELLKDNKINLCRVEVSPGNLAEDVYKKWNFKVDKHRLSLNI